MDLSLQLAERFDKTYEQASNGAREQLNEATLQRIIDENKHISEYEFAEPFGSLLGDRFLELSPQVSKCGGQWIILKKFP